MRLITKLWATLLLLCVAGVANAAKEYEVDQKFSTIAELDGKSFAIVDISPATPTAMGIGIPNHGNGWDMYFGTITEAYNSNACFYKLEAAQGEGLDGYYYLRTYKADGTMYTAWGNTSTMGFFNSQTATGTCCFALGLVHNDVNVNGQDGENLAVWAIEPDNSGDGQFALKNIGTGLYLHGDNLPAKYEDPYYFTFCTLKEKAQTDPLADQKDALNAAIAKGKMFNALAYTDATFATLTAKVADGETALAAESATAESLTNATTDITDAIAALAFKEGFSSLQDVEFGSWTGWGTEAQFSQKVNPIWVLFEPTGQSYGDGSVNNRADVSAYDKLYIAVVSGSPRILLNRDVADGQWNEDEAQSHLIDNTKGGWSAKYFTTENGIVTVDLKQLTADKGFAHLTAIKSYDNNVISGLYLYKAPAVVPTPTELTIVDWVASEQNYENAQVLTDVAIAIDAKTTMTCAKGTGKTDPAYYTSGNAVRTYGGNTITFAGKGITKIVITGVSGKVADLTASTGELTKDGITTTWKGEADEIVLTNSTTDQQHIASLHVVYGGIEPEVHIANTADSAYTVAKAIELIDAGKALSDTVFVKGIISQVDKIQSGAITYWISDDGTTEGQQFQCYKGKNINGADFAAVEDVEVGAVVTVKGTLKKYNDTYELNQGNELVSYKAPFKPLFAEGSYYIKNVGTQKYLAAGSNWGTHAVVNEFGLDYAITIADGKYTIDSQVSNGGQNNFLNGEWNDGAAFGWTLTQVAEGKFTISNGEKFLTAGENDVVTLGTDATAEAAQWTAIAVADRVATLEAATAENGVDATFLIKGANFTRNDLRNKAWTATKSGGNQTIAGPSGERTTYGCESWNNTFEISQTIENLPEGVYEFTIAGYGTNGTTKIFANEVEAAFVNVESAADFGAALDAIAAGSYTGNTTGKFNLLTNTLKIGVKRTSQVGADWTVFDNARLTYFGAIPADAFKTAYETALKAAQDALADEANAVITGEEKTALEKAITDYTTVDDNADAYKAATAALNAATLTFTSAKSAYDALATAKAEKAALSFAYATADKKAAAEATLTAEATSAADATAKVEAIAKAYRQYAESSALLEGVEGAVNKTDAIINPTAEADIAEPWVVVKGEGSNGALDVKNGEPWTDGADNSTHKYFDGGDWGAQAWNVALEQKIELPAGKYMLTAKGRASADVDLNLFAGVDTVKMASIGAANGLFNRGWNDASVEFELKNDSTITIGVRGITTKQYNWMSFSDFRLMQFPVPAEITHTWDFTKWSEATVTNLKADAAASKLTGWSDVEKKTDAEADAEPTEASKDNCFWAVIPEGGELKANDVAIEELKGLEFGATFAGNRSLAIAVNYPSTSLGDYAGPAYLWLGGANFECFTIKNVKAGTQIKMGVESHKPAQARGVQLLIGETVLTDPEGATVEAPTTYTEQTWAVPGEEGVVDIVVKNTNGCHVYFIDAEIGEASVPEDPELEVAEGWHSVIENGNLATDNVANFFIKENGGDPMPAVIVAGAGKNGSRGIVINTPDNPSTDWDAQFFIQANEDIPAGYKIHVEFDYMATQEAGFDTQSHSAPGDYIHWYCVDSYTANTEWQHMSKEVEVSAAKLDNGNLSGEWGKACDASEHGKPFKTIGFNLSKVKTATVFHFDNITFWVTDVATGIVNVKNEKNNDVIYNLNGLKVNKAQKGLYIINGKKVVIK